MIGWIHRLNSASLIKVSLVCVFVTLSSAAWSGVSQDNIVRGEKIYNKSCIKCHGKEKSGAPQLTDKKAWDKRIQQPRHRLMQHVLKGFKKMPPRGGDTSLNVRKVSDALDYMLFTILGLEDVIVQQAAAANKGDNKSAAKNDSKNKAATKQDREKDVTKSKEPSADKEPSANKEPSAASESSAGNEPSANNNKEQAPSTTSESSAIESSLANEALAANNEHDEFQQNVNAAMGEQISTFLSQITTVKNPLDEATLGIPQDKYGDDVRLGFRIFTQTAEYAGRYNGNDLSCSNCHLDAGRRKFAAPMWAAIGMYPAYKRRNDRNNTLEDRIQQCFQFSLNGFAPSPDSPEVRALISYIHFISRGVPIGFNMPGRGFVDIENTGFDPNPSRGLKNYEKNCAVCHQADGSGKRNEKGKGFEIPPLWGRHAFNKAAGFNHVRKLAGFIKSNMPPGKSDLSSQEALDIAAYINQQIRPGDPRKGLFDAWFGD